MTRRWTWLVVAVLAAAGVAIAVVATSSSGSTTRPLIVTANVTRQSLQDKVTLTGTLSRLEQRQVFATSAAQISEVHISDGNVVQAGQSILAVNGRDAVAVEGAFPFFRSLDVGDSGPDVQQLNEILTAHGDNPGPVSPLYTDQTRFALAQWQAAHGYPGVAPQKPQTVTVSLAQSTGYKVGPEATAALTIGPSVPSPVRPAPPAATAASVLAQPPPASSATAAAATAAVASAASAGAAGASAAVAAPVVPAVYHSGPVQARFDAATMGPVASDPTVPVL